MNFEVVVAYILGIALLYMLGYLLQYPLRFVLRLIYNALLGGLALLAINLVGGWFSVTLPLNPVTALVAGLLGLPGLILLLVLKLILPF